jgi:histone H3/H4
MSETIIVKTKLKELVKGYNVSGDFAEALDVKVKALIQDAMKRAEGNNRKTVMAKDI